MTIEYPNEHRRLRFISGPLRALPLLYPSEMQNFCWVKQGKHVISHGITSPRHNSEVPPIILNAEPLGLP